MTGSVPSFAQAYQKTNTVVMEKDFPLYPSIKPNVDFWIDIFTKVSKHEGLLHDVNNLSLVYSTIRLDGSQTSPARKKNRKIKKNAIKKYKTILLNLANGKKPSSTEEEQILALFGNKPEPALLKRAAFNLRIQTGLKEEFKGGLIRSGAYILRFKKIFASYGLPSDLVYLPCVESSFRTQAYSKFGAAGIWQFTRSTGRLYMDIGYVVDERRDPFIATDAAARLLKRNYENLKEWPLAITAYNHGMNGMLKAKKTKGSYEQIFKSYRSRSFKFASRNFYSEFLAARQVAKNYQTYFGPLSFDKPRSFNKITTHGFLSIDDVSKALNISQRKLQKLNPSLRKPVFNNQKYIPKNFDLKLPESIDRKKSIGILAGLYKKEQKPSRFHRVQKGDTAGKVARIHSVSLSDLILANGLNRKATIYVGQNLRIPVKGEHIVAQKTAEKKTEIKTIKKQPQPVLQKPAIKTKTDTSTKVPVVKEAVAIEKPTKETIQPEIVTSNLKITTSPVNPDIGIIRVEAEETLGHFADWLDIKTNVIRKLNNLSYGTPINIDQKIKLPLKINSKTSFEEKRYEFHKEMEEDFFESYIVQGTDVYQVQSGDNIWSLCLNELEVPFWLLKKYNPDTRFQSLLPQQKLVYPIIEKKEAE